MALNENVPDPSARKSAEKDDPFTGLALASSNLPTITEEEALLLAINADRSNDGPLQMYADYLTSRGDPRGEFVALQLRIARGEGTTQMEKMEADLWKTHRHQWTREILDNLSATLYFERGLA